MIDKIPLNTYVLPIAVRLCTACADLIIPYGFANESALDQFATTDAVELGFAPNVPYLHASAMRGNPFVDAALRQKGDELSRWDARCFVWLAY